MLGMLSDICACASGEVALKTRACDMEVIGGFRGGEGIQVREEKERISALEKENAELRARLETFEPKPDPQAVEDAEKRLAALPAVKGASFAAFETGVRYKGRPDLMVAYLDPGTTVAGLATSSATAAAPVLDCRRKIAALSVSGCPHGIGLVVNAGNANAFTGEAGMKTVTEISRAAADSLNIPAECVLTASTGVIGEPLKSDPIHKALAKAGRGELSPSRLDEAARAILTTDTYPKCAFVQTEIGHGREQVNIVGIAKGSGMICPDMATMLAFVFTDAKIQYRLLSRIASGANETSFNSITVDGDTSTNDTLIIAATGRSEAPEIEAGGIDAQRFERGMRTVLSSLARQILRDGEGATKLVGIHVEGAASKPDAVSAAESVANSPLVKTAVAGEDPNWGRVVMALGKSGAEFNQEKLAIRFGDHMVAEHGGVSKHFSEAAVAEYMTGSDIDIRIDLGNGAESASVHTCDFTHGYIMINADYRT